MTEDSRKVSKCLGVRCGLSWKTESEEIRLCPIYVRAGLPPASPY
jgi:hypothetical protein